jgi:hypothetical protein
VTTLLQKSQQLFEIARSIECEDYFNEVTVGDQRILEEIVCGIRAAGRLLVLHVESMDRREEILNRAEKPKLRVIK